MIETVRIALFLGWRYLKPRRNAISIINGISAVGVALGVALLIVVIAVMTGFTEEFKEKILDTMAHIQISDPVNGYISSTKKILSEIKSAGYKGSPIVHKMGLMQVEKKLFPIGIFGIDSSTVNDAISLNKHLKEGDARLSERQILISEETALRLGLCIGSKIVIHSPAKLTKMVEFNETKGIVPVKDKVYLPTEFEVAGIFSFGKYDFDSSVVFINIEDANELFDLPLGAATEVYVSIPDPMAPESARSLLAQKLPEYTVQSWKQLNSQFLGVLAVEKTMMFFLLIFVVIVAAFSISASLITFVIKKIKEIGLLKAMGASNSMILAVFTLKGLVVGVTGTIFGTIIGIAAIYWRNEFMFALRRFTGIEIFPKKFYFFSELPASIRLEDLVIIWILSISLCIIGALLPSFCAASIDPAKALRYE